jgi:PadR family transcriptional regulator, regulatory protein PadR
LVYSVEHMLQDHLGEFEQIVLLSVVRLGDGAYGVPIRQEIEKRIGREVTVGALYSTLDRLEAKGYLQSWFGDPTPRRGGRSKRYFQLLPAGLHALTDCRAMLDRMWRGIRLKGQSHV